MTIDRNQPKSLCIVMLGDISETIHILPVANTLKRTWPQAKIAWVIQSSLKTLVQGHPAIDNFITYKKQKGINALIGSDSPEPFGGAVFHDSAIWIKKII